MFFVARCDILYVVFCGYDGIGRHAGCGSCVREDAVETIQYADMMELADMQDLGSCVERRVGSSPTIRSDSNRKRDHQAAGEVLPLPLNGEGTGFRIFFDDLILLGCYLLSLAANIHLDPTELKLPFLCEGSLD